jgi:signal transduction histidine kinase
LLEGTAVSREQVAGALLVKVQDLRFKARRLASREHQEVVLIQRRADHLVLVALAALTLLSVTLLTWLSRRLLRGLDRLGAGMHRVAGGDLAHEVTGERDDELGRLAAAFNGMTGRLRASQALVEERTAALKRRGAELVAANADLEAFSYSVSHDLRAPLRAIDGFAAILREDYAPRLDTEGVRLLGVVSDNARRMGQLIDDILAFSRAGRQTLRLVRLDMKALVLEVWQGLEPQRAGRAVELRLAELPPAWGDPGAVRQVWQNLLGNALKFSRSRDPALIEITGRQEADATHYCASDNGVGFDPAYSGKLFGLFQRLHGMDEFEGTGVGLAIVKRYIEKHGGLVAGEGHPGTGACFRFSLPGGPDDH